VTVTQLAAIVGPAVLLLTLAWRACLWLVRAVQRTAQRITDLERRATEHDQALHRIGSALHDHD
jgi:hypothetical protein